MSWIRRKWVHFPLENMTKKLYTSQNIFITWKNGKFTDFFLKKKNHTILQKAKKHIRWNKIIYRVHRYIEYKGLLTLIATVSMIWQGVTVYSKLLLPLKTNFLNEFSIQQPLRVNFDKIIMTALSFTGKFEPFTDFTKCL